MIFNNISKKFISVIKDISGYGRITEEKIQDTLRKIRIILLEADVSLLVIKEVINKIKKKLIGKDINDHLTPGQEFIKILKKELISIVSYKLQKLNLSPKILNIILIIGLQGSGKTTSVAKLGKWIIKNNKKKVLIASTDIYRPAAIKQLKVLSNQSKIDFFQSKYHDNPIKISIECVQTASNGYDVLILDTAGRLHNDSDMIQEICNIQKIIQPCETLLTIDSMMGQDTINIATQFKKYINISGLILTKVDSDARGGSALSASYTVQKPIKFIGTGEKIESFSIFNPEEIVSKILGMDDIINVIEKIDKKIKIKKSNELIKKNHKLDLNDFKNQIKNIQKIGGINSIISKLSVNFFNLKQFNNFNDNNYIKKIEAMINSMTIIERKNPKIIKSSRKKRIAKGSGTNIQDVNQLLKQFNEFKCTIEKVKKIGVQKTFQNFKNMIPKLF